MVRVDEALATAHVAAEVERGDLHPVGPVAEMDVGDPPQAFAGLDGVDRVDRMARSRGQGGRGRCGRPSDGGDGSDGGARRGGTGPGRQHQGSAGGGQGEHTHGDTRRDPVQGRHDADRSHLTASDVQRDTADELRGAGRPRDPRRKCQGHERVPRSGLPGVTETARQGVAHDEHEDRGHRGEREERRDQCTDDVGHPVRPPPLPPRGSPSRVAGLSHRPARS